MNFYYSVVAHFRPSAARFQLLLIGLLLCCCAVTVAAQETETLKIDTALVSVPLIVSDQQGRYVPGLQAADFTLYENRIKQPIEFFAAVEEPLNVALLLDTSFSARFVLDDIKDAAHDFLKQLRPQDRALILSFDWQVKMLSPLTGDRKALDRAIKQASIGEQFGTLMRTAVDQVLRQHFKSRTGRKAIILLTDGKDAGSSSVPPRRLVETATEADTMIYSIFYTTGPPSLPAGRRRQPNPEQRERRAQREQQVEAANKMAIDFLQRLSEASAGRYYQSEVTNLKKTFGLIADELRHQYRLGFYPPDHPVGSTHTLQVEVARAGLVVRARRSYRVVERQ
jgi:VWFA-related protein